MNTKQIKVKMVLAKRTKHTHVYEEQSNSEGLESVVPTLYVKTFSLTSFFGGAPDSLTLTISIPSEDEDEA